MGHSVRPPDLQKRRVAFQIDSLFPIILLGFRLHYRQNVGTHLEATQPRTHQSKRAVSRLRETSRTMVHFTRAGGGREHSTWTRLRCESAAGWSQPSSLQGHKPRGGWSCGRGWGARLCASNRTWIRSSETEEGQIREIKELLHFRPKQHSLPVEKLGGSPKRA